MWLYKIHCDHRNSDPERENVGHKWSLSALLDHLRKEYCINTDSLMDEIEDIVIKTIMSATSQMLPAINCFVPNNQNCFGNFFYWYN